MRPSTIENKSSPSQTLKKLRGALTLVVVCASLFLGAQDSSYALIQFTEQQHWVSSVTEGSVVEHKFRFVNAGNAPLIITEVNRTFVPDNDLKEPIAPGDSGNVLIRYTTSGHPGYFDKSATVKSNSRNGDVVLHLRGQVIPKPDPNGAIMKFDTTTYWFDTTYSGSTIDHEFRFVNTGKSPLIISSCNGSSGCIMPEYPKDPIAPGKSAVIRVVFNTTGKMGRQDKCITVTSNASEPVIVLHIKGVVIPAPKNEVSEPSRK